MFDLFGAIGKLLGVNNDDEKKRRLQQAQQQKPAQNIVNPGFNQKFSPTTFNPGLPKIQNVKPKTPLINKAGVDVSLPPVVAPPAVPNPNFDEQRRQQQQQSAKAFQDRHSKGVPIQDVARGFLGGTAKLTNSGLGVAEKLGVNVLGGTQKLFGDKIGGERTINEGVRSIDQRLLNKGKGFLGAGGIFNSEQEMRKASTGDALRKVGGTTLQSAGEVLPIGRGIKVAQRSAPIVQKLLQGSLQGTAASAVGNTGAQIAERGTLDPIELAKNMATGLVGGAIPGIGAGLSRLRNVLQKLESLSKAIPRENIPRQTSVDMPQLPQRTIQTAETAPQVPLRQSKLIQSSDNNIPIAPNPQFNARDYVNQQAKAQQLARTAGDTSIVGKLKNEIGTKLIDSFSPIEKTLNKAIKDGADIKISDANHITPQLDRAIRADTIAGQYIKDNGLADVIQKAPDTKALDQYLIAKHAADLESQGVKTGRNLEADKQLVASLSDVYEPHAQAITKYNQQLLDKTVDYGLISKETADQLKKQYPNYVPANRIFGENELNTFKGSGGGKASVGTQKAIQKIKGSERDIESPLSSIAAKTQDIIKQGEANKAASILASYKDLPGNPFGITPIRTAEHVKTRIDLYSQAKELKPVQDKLSRIERTHAGWARNLQSELDKLNKKGLFLALKPQDTKSIPIKGKAFAYNTNQEIHNARSVGDRGQKNIGAAREITGNLIERQTISGGASARETKLLVNSLINAPKSELERLKSQISTKDNKLGDVIDQLEGIRNTVEGVKNNREALRLEALGYKDLSATNKPTISFYKDGIKEIYETTPEIEAAAKSLNKEQIGILGKIVRVPTRMLRLGATGVNAGFALANLAKDMASAALNSSHPLRSSVLNPKVLGKATSAAFNHKGAAYSELVREGAGGTSFDIARDAPVQTVAQIRAGKNIKSKMAYNVKHPAELLRAVENTIGRSEEFTRALQYYGNKNAALAKNATQAEAARYGAHAARNNTINFARAGEYGAVLNSALPYLNAGIQGARTFVRNAKDRPLQTAAKVAILSTLPALTTTAWNLSTPERRAAYDDISDYEKDGNLIIVPEHPVKDPKTGRWNVIKIPVSQEVASLNNIARNGLESAAGDANFNVGSVLADLIGTTTSLNVHSGREMAGQATPQIIKPLVETITNQNLFTGNQIVPDSQKNLPASQQYGDYTSGTAKVLGNIGLSPRLLDNGFKTSFGGAGQTAINVSDNALAKLGAIKPEEVQGKTIGSSVSDRFMGASSKPASTYASNAFETAKKTLIQSSEYKKLPQEEQSKALNRLQNDVTAIVYNKQDQVNPSSKYTPKDLTSNQKDLISGTRSITDYTVSPDDASKEKTYKEQYDDAVTDFNKKSSTYSSVQKAKKQKDIEQLKVKKDFDTDTVSLYGMSKEDAYSLLSTDPKGKVMADKLLKYGDALVAAGLASTNKFKDKYGNVAIQPKAKSTGKKGGKKGAKKVPAKSSFNRVASTAAIRKLLQSSGKKLG